MAMPKSLRVLVVEDSVDDTFFIVRELQRAGYLVDFERVETAAGLETALDEQNWDLIISDYRMPQFDGAAALALYRQKGLDLPFIMVSGAMGEDLAVEMLKAGAHDYVKKDNLGRLVTAVEGELTAAQERRTRKQTEAATAYLASIVQSCDDAIVGKSLEGTILSWNAGAERLYGYSAVEVIGRSVAILFPPERERELAQIMQTVKAGGHLEGLGTVRRRKDGSLVRVSLTVSPIKDNTGQIVGASTVARRIAENQGSDSKGKVLQKAAAT